MENRFNMQHVQPEGYKAMFGLEVYLQKSALSKTHKELIKLRASQINGCAYCLDMHSKDAIKLGESIQRIVLLDAWKETNLYTEQERIVLELTEAVTLIHQGGISDELYQKAEAALGKEYVAQVIMMIVTINAWNRIAISTHLQPGE
ncbi:carboxymuconolactone decarboxylase family protein [Dyadobacter luteus]|jgi:AhpD family alkylhydroperoxidase|uniref:Carboxymuconolactone decarboxylase family protein n=1 Tax=Dyadobacter luteus TaxID=2259619 RepID=A0A3D8YGJ8_9BACT|nr:carboxymuconolactone decarboxylase family protein [Dyadobacter luteus]REA63684.1 carboxymuconolactone decarboxylase family protein [Dyadobacter luteus]